MDVETPTHPGFEEILSTDRFGTYLVWAGGDRNKAVGLYTLNAQFCESMQTPLHMLEIALRNRIHVVLSEAYGTMWFDTEGLLINPVQVEMLAKARQVLGDAKKDETPGRLVAALTFGYWTAMFGSDYDILWQKTLKDIAKRENGKGLTRKDFSRLLGPVRTLRNRIAHHEPILYWDLRKHHAAILQMVRWLSPAAADWCREVSRFETVYPANWTPLPKPLAGASPAD